MNKKQIIYVHGGGAYTNYNAFLQDLGLMVPRDLPSSETKKKWSMTFAEDLGNEYEVFMPSMPNKQNAKYDEWKLWFERYFEYLNNEVVLIGVSLGAYFLAKYLSENTPPFSIQALFLLAGPYENFTSEGSGEDGGDFEPIHSNLRSIQNKCGKIYIMHSKDDFVVPYEHALKYAEALPQAELVTFEDKNHFLVEEFPELLSAIRSLS